MTAEQQTLDVVEAAPIIAPKVAEKSKVQPLALVNEHLEDCGVRGIPTPEERLREYRIQGRKLPTLKKAKFWSGVLEADPAVAKLCTADGTPLKKKRFRSRKDEDVPLHKEIGLIEENGVCQ